MYLKVNNKHAEEVRRRLLDKNVFDLRMQVIRQGQYILFPVSRKILLPKTTFVDLKPQKKKEKPKSLHEALKDMLTSEELSDVPSAFDVIGDIAVLDLPPTRSPKKKLVAETLLSVFKNIKVVVNKTSRVDTDYRTRSVELLAGENRTLTVHKEYGCKLKVDVAETYFSPRLGTERMRVASKVRENEEVLVLFAGVGPYAILIAKKTKPARIVAVELNPKAVELMRDNVRSNKVNVEVVAGDARTETPKLGKFDRIIMPLPKDAGEFLDVALRALKKNGVVHFYSFAHNPREAAAEVSKRVGQLGYGIKVLDAVECGSYSPCLSRACVDFTLV